MENYTKNTLPMNWYLIYTKAKLPLQIALIGGFWVNTLIDFFFKETYYLAYIIIISIFCASICIFTFLTLDEFEKHTKNSLTLIIVWLIFDLCFLIICKFYILALVYLLFNVLYFYKRKNIFKN